MNQKQKNGFTLVELIIVIVVIVILAVISILGYSYMSNKAARTSIVSTLKQASSKIKVEQMKRGDTAQVIDDFNNDNPAIELELVPMGGGGVYYSGLSSPQNGKLFYDICRELVDEGLGKGPNDFGSSTIDYISACNVYNTHYLQINGWNGGFNVSEPSVTKGILQSYVDQAATSHPSHPSYHATLQGFMDQLILRHEARGGQFPITEFWQPWTGEPTLPAPEQQVVDRRQFCLRATHSEHENLVYTLFSEDSSPKESSGC